MANPRVTEAQTPRAGRRRVSRRRRLLTRGAPVVVLAAAAFAGGAILASAPARSERRTVTRYATAWVHHDTRAMYALLDTGSRARLTETRFAARLRGAAATATLTGLQVLRVDRPQHGRGQVAMEIDTRVWGRLRETLTVPLTGQGADARVHLDDAVMFPGLRPGETLTRRMRLATRGTLLAADGTPLARGAQRTSPIPDIAEQVVGTLGRVPTAETARFRARGFPDDARVGLVGLEHIFQSRLAGTPGGSLLAGRRRLAQVAPRPGATVRTTIVPEVERAAVAAVGGRYAGMAVMNPRTGALSALVGLAFSALQPPGSTMKIVTATAALQARLVTLKTTFPVETGATIDGFTMQNAGGEACGGTLLNAFAVSCNSVFAPLGVKVGARRLVATARRFGFDETPSVLGAAEPSIPAPAVIGSHLALAASAIGQGKVLSTPLEQADVAATIAMGGRRPIPTLRAGARPRFVRVTAPAVAREVQSMMEAVVAYGTGTAAQIPGVRVAGKTGTAELTDTGTGASDPSTADDPKNTDAWFVGYAPVGRPKVVGAALFPNAGAGAATAAPPVRAVIEAALAR